MLQTDIFGLGYGSTRLGGKLCKGGLDGSYDNMSRVWCWDRRGGAGQCSQSRAGDRVMRDTDYKHSTILRCNVFVRRGLSLYLAEILIRWLDTVMRCICMKRTQLAIAVTLIRRLDSKVWCFCTQRTQFPILQNEGNRCEGQQRSATASHPVV